MGYATNPGPYDVLLYEHINYQNEMNLSLNSDYVDENECYNLSYSYIDNAASSIKVGSNVFAILYADKDCKGAHIIFAPGYKFRNLCDLAFNDKASSIKIIKKENMPFKGDAMWAIRGFVIPRDIRVNSKIVKVKQHSPNNGLYKVRVEVGERSCESDWVNITNISGYVNISHLSYELDPKFLTKFYCMAEYVRGGYSTYNYPPRFPFRNGGISVVNHYKGTCYDGCDGWENNCFGDDGYAKMYVLAMWLVPNKTKYIKLKDIEFDDYGIFVFYKYNKTSNEYNAIDWYYSSLGNRPDSEEEITLQKDQLYMIVVFVFDKETGPTWFRFWNIKNTIEEFFGDMKYAGSSPPPQYEAKCKNDYDDDFDGKTDCEDPDCAGKLGPNNKKCCQSNNDCDQGYECKNFECVQQQPQYWWCDKDGDGYKGRYTSLQQGVECSTTQPQQEDCDDNDDTVYPGAPEICNDGKDNDCDGKVDCQDSDCQGTSQCECSVENKYTIRWNSFKNERLIFTDTLWVTFKSRSPSNQPYDFHVHRLSPPYDILWHLSNDTLHFPSTVNKTDPKIIYIAYNIGNENIKLFRIKDTEMISSRTINNVGKISSIYYNSQDDNIYLLNQSCHLFSYNLSSHEKKYIGHLENENNCFIGNENDAIYEYSKFAIHNNILTALLLNPKRIAQFNLNEINNGEINKIREKVLNGNYVGFDFEDDKIYMLKTEQPRSAELVVWNYNLNEVNSYQFSMEYYNLPYELEKAHGNNFFILPWTTENIKIIKKIYNCQEAQPPAHNTTARSIPELVERLVAYDNTSRAWNLKKWLHNGTKQAIIGFDDAHGFDKDYNEPLVLIKLFNKSGKAQEINEAVENGTFLLRILNNGGHNITLYLNESGNLTRLWEGRESFTNEIGRGKVTIDVGSGGKLPNWLNNSNFDGPSKNATIVYNTSATTIMELFERLEAYDKIVRARNCKKILTNNTIGFSDYNCGNNGSTQPLIIVQHFWDSHAARKCYNSTAEPDWCDKIKGELGVEKNISEFDVPTSNGTFVLFIFHSGWNNNSLYLVENGKNYSLWNGSKEAIGIVKLNIVTKPNITQAFWQPNEIAKGNPVKIAVKVENARQDDKVNVTVYRVYKRDIIIGLVIKDYITGFFVALGNFITGKAVNWPWQGYAIDGEDDTLIREEEVDSFSNIDIQNSWANISLTENNYSSWLDGLDYCNATNSCYFYFIAKMADNASIKRQSNRLYIHGEGFNKPPVAKIVYPDNGYDFKINETSIKLWLNETSHDPDGYIESWKWYKRGKGPNAEWRLIGRCSYPSSGCNKTHNFGLGSYTIKLEVTDNKGATDTDEISISIWNEQYGAEPIAIISEPKKGDTLKNSTVKFNASLSYDPDDCNEPSTDPCGIVWYYWNFGDETGWWYTSSQVIDHLYELQSPIQEYTAELYVQDDEGNLSSKVDVTFTIDLTQPPVCYCEKDSYYVSCGQCLDQYYCKDHQNLVEDCRLCNYQCPQGYICNVENGECVEEQTPEECNGLPKNDCEDTTGCFWEQNGFAECRACQEIRQTGLYCSGYKTKYACENDSRTCNVAWDACGNNLDCLQDKPECVWDSTDSKCKLQFSYQQDGQQIDCRQTITLDPPQGCTEGVAQVTKHIKWEYSEDGGLTWNDDTQPYKCGQPTTETVACPQPPALKMPGWSWINVVAVLLLLGFYYMWKLSSRGKKKVRRKK